jgi:DNA mismatch endonuclease, patch repair protein
MFHNVAVVISEARRALYSFWMDWLTPEQRSRNMAAIRSRGNKSTERALRYRLMRAGIRGWRLYPGDVPGKPDFVFDEAGLVVFVDGCYWHGCPRCYRAPTSNESYWSQKLARNKNRDRTVTRALRKEGWTVVRFWEHQIEGKPRKVVEKIERLLT